MSFARSHTLTSFDDAVTTQRQEQPSYGHPTSNRGQGGQYNRLGTPTRSQERLLGGKTPTLTMQVPPVAAQVLLQQASLPMSHYAQVPTGGPLSSTQEASLNVEKVKRKVMKTQATQTEEKKALSPRSARRVLTKSLSEVHHPHQHAPVPRTPHEHEQLHRTVSEEPPRSPFDGSFHLPRTPSRQSTFTERSGHSRNPSAESGSSFRSTDFSSRDSVISFKPDAEVFSDSEGALERLSYDCHSLPRKSCMHHRSTSHGQEQRYTHSLPRREQHRTPCRHGQQAVGEPQRRLSHSGCSLARAQWEEEQEILIDFKPRLSPPERQGGLLKTRSEGEILCERRREEPVQSATSQSEEDLQTQQQRRQVERQEERFRYQNLPIKDEGICGQQKLFPNGHGHREGLRRRSVSLEEPQTESLEESPSTDATREQSDSQVTVNEVSPVQQREQPQRRRSLVPLGSTPEGPGRDWENGGPRRMSMQVSPMVVRPCPVVQMKTLEAPKFR